MNEPKPSPCAFCGGDSEYLCDAIIALMHSHDRPTKAWTCDLKLCASCASNAGRLIVCGADGCVRETRDHCPLHDGDRSPWQHVETFAEVRGLRRALRKRARLFTRLEKARQSEFRPLGVRK